MYDGDNLLDILKTGGDLKDVVGIWNCSQEQAQRDLRRKLNIIEDKSCTLKNNEIRLLKIFVITWKR